MKLHHIGIATNDIEEMVTYLNKMYKVIDKTDIIHDPLQKTDLCMLTLEDGSCLELIKGEKVNRFVDKKQYLYHLCYEVEDLDEKLKKYRECGDIIMMKPTPAILFNNKRVAFVFSKIGIIELVEK